MWWPCSRSPRGWCAARGGGEEGPPDTAAELVPAGALAYVHLSTDPGREADRRLVRLAGALPPLVRLRDRAVGAVSPQAFDLERDVRPWLGAELAYAAVSPTDSLVLAAVADRPKANALVARVGNLSGAARYRGVQVLVAGASALAFVGDFLALGTEPAVRAAIDRDQGEGESLAGLAGYEAALADAPAERSVAAYASAAGVREVLAPRGGLLGALGALLDRPGLTAAGATVTAEAGGLRAHVRLAGGAPRGRGVRARAAGAHPGAGGRVPRRAGRAAARAAAREAGRGRPARGAADGAARRGRDRPGPRRAGAARRGDRARHQRAGGRSRGAPAGGAPVVTLKATTSDPPATEAALARLQEPLARRLALPGTVPGFKPGTIGGLEAYTLRATPELAPTYALSGDVVVLSTAPAGLAPPRGTLAGAAAFRATLGAVPPEADSLVFLDLRQLLALGEQTGLTAIPGLASARDDLRRASAVGAVVTQDPAHTTDTTAELFLQIP